MPQKAAPYAGPISRATAAASTSTATTTAARRAAKTRLGVEAVPLASEDTCRRVDAGALVADAGGAPVEARGGGSAGVDVGAQDAEGEGFATTAKKGGWR